MAPTTDYQDLSARYMIPNGSSLPTNRNSGPHTMHQHDGRSLVDPQSPRARLAARSHHDQLELEQDASRPFLHPVAGIICCILFLCFFAWYVHRLATLRRREAEWPVAMKWSESERSPLLERAGEGNETDTTTSSEADVESNADGPVESQPQAVPVGKRDVRAPRE